MKIFTVLTTTKSYVYTFLLFNGSNNLADMQILSHYLNRGHETWKITARVHMHPPLWVLRRETCKCISLEKTLHWTLHFQRQAQLVKVTPYRRQDRNTQWARHASINLSFVGLILSCFLCFGKTTLFCKFYWTIFLLLFEPRKTQWRHSRGNSWKIYFCSCDRHYWHLCSCLHLFFVIIIVSQFYMVTLHWGFSHAMLSLFFFIYYLFIYFKD